MPRSSPPADGDAAATSLGGWIRVRRRMLGLTQAELASRVPCAAITLRKLEADERRPSRQVAECLAGALELDEEGAARFLAAARTAFSPEMAPSDAGGVGHARSIPAPPTALIGRANEVDALFARLSPAGGGARLLTITGPPGVGKTRLAIALAERIEAKLELTVTWVDLSGVAEPTAVPAAIARAVTPPELQGAPLDDLALRALQRASSVLVLDNGEHLVAGMDHLIELLEACPGLVCIATSRTPFGLHGEHEFVVDPLSVLDVEGGPGPAIALFLDRAQQVGWLVPEPDDPLVHSIVGRVGGLPLAIELAALRLRDQGLAGLDASLASGLDSLGANRRGVPSRHATLAAAVVWSESLLEPTELAVLEALAAFPSGGSVAAVAKVAAQDPDATETALRSLVHAALVERPERDAKPTTRYVPFVVVREHVRSRLDPCALAEARRRHAGVTLREAEARLPGITAWPEPVHLAALDELDDDLQAALNWSFEPDGDVDTGLRLAVSAVSGWLMRGRVDECARWAAVALVVCPRSHVARYLDAAVRWFQDDPEAAARMEAAVEAAAAAGDVRWLAECAGVAQTIALSHGDIARAVELGPRAISTGEAAGGEWEALVHLRNGSLAVRLGDLDAARHHSRGCIECYEALGSTWGQGVAYRLAGAVAAAEGRPADAATAYLRSVEVFSVLGLPQYVSGSIVSCGQLLLSLGHAEGAAVLFGMVESWLDELGTDVQAMARLDWHMGRQGARERLGSAYDEAAARGAAMLRDLESVRAVLADSGFDPATR